MKNIRLHINKTFRLAIISFMFSCAFFINNVLAQVSNQDVNAIIEMAKNKDIPISEITSTLNKNKETMGKLGFSYEVITNLQGTNTYRYDLSVPLQKAALESLKAQKKAKTISEQEYKDIYKKIALAFDDYIVADSKFNSDYGKSRGQSAKDDDDFFTKEETDDRIKAMESNLDLNKKIKEQEAKEKEKEKLAEEKLEKSKKLNTENCDIPSYREKYTSSCYSCLVVKLLVETFMEACTKFYGLAKEIATIVLMIGSVIWLAFYAFKAVSSWVAVEPANLLGDIAGFLFKMLVAYVFINAGVGTLVSYTVDPLISLGADYGIGVLEGKDHLPSMTPEQEQKAREQMKAIKYEGPPIVGSKAINKILEVNILLDKKVATNLVVGNVLMCHAIYGGAWVDDKILTYTVRIPNVWILICGFAIWFVGFMLTLSISYYLLDISFKMGFAVVFIPIGIALYVFEMTKDKLAKCISIIIKSGAILAFLAITTSYMFVLIDAAFGDGGIQQIYLEVEAGRTQWISDRFEIFGSYLFLILFAYFYSFKLVGATINEYVDSMFSDGVFGSASPMHHRAKQMTDLAKQVGTKLAVGGAKFGGKIVGDLVDDAKQGEIGGSSIVGNSFKIAGSLASSPGKFIKDIGQKAYKAGESMSSHGGVGKFVGSGFKGFGKGSMAVGSVLAKPGELSTDLGKGINSVYRFTKEEIKEVGRDVKEFGKDVAFGAEDLLYKGKEKIEDAANKYIADPLKQGANWVEDKAEQGANYVVDPLKQGASWVGDKVEQGVGYVVDPLKQGANWVGDKAEQGVSYVGGKIEQGANYIIDPLKQGVDKLGNKIDQGADWVSDKADRLGEKVDRAVNTASLNVALKTEFIKEDIKKNIIDPTVARYEKVESKVNKAVDRADAYISDKAKKLDDKIDRVVDKAVDPLRQGANWVSDKTSSGADWVSDKADRLGEKVDRAVNTASLNVALKTEFIKEDIKKNIIDPTVARYEKVESKVNKAVDRADAYISDKAKKLDDKIDRVVDKAVDPLRQGANWVSDKTSSGADWVSDKADRLGEKVDRAVNTASLNVALKTEFIKEDIKKTMDPIVQKVDKVVEKVEKSVDKVVSAVERAKEGVKNTTKDLYEETRRAKEQIRKDVEGKTSELKEAMKEIKNRAKERAENNANALREMVEGREAVRREKQNAREASAKEREKIRKEREEIRARRGGGNEEDRRKKRN